MLARFFAWIGRLMRRRFYAFSSVAVASGPDLIPDAFSFTAVGNAALSTIYISNTITVSGVTPGFSVGGSLSGAGFTYSQNGAAYQAPGAFTFQNGDTFTLRGTSSGANSTGETAVLSLGITLSNWTVTTLASVAGLATPTLRIVSALGTVPLTLGFDDPDYIAGDYGQLEVASDSGFATITQNLVFFIDGASWVLTDEAIGLANPAGPYWSRFRIARDNDSGLTTVTGTDPLGSAVSFTADVSAWSNVVNDTIGAQAALNTSNGVNKDSLLTVTGSPALSFSGTSTNGNNSVRSTLQQGFNKAQFEVTITGGAATGTTVVGIDDGTTNFNTAHGMPGLDGTSGVGSGIAVAFYSSGSTISIFDNAGGTQIDLTTAAGSVANNDTFTVVYDKVNNTLEVWRTRSGTTVQIGATQTGLPALSAQWAYCGTRSSTSAGTMNFGSTAYAKAPGTGVAAFWA